MGIQHILESNNDVCNDEPNSYQDCSDVVHISIFFDGTGNNKDEDEELKKWSNPARLWKNAGQFVLDKQTQKIKSYYAIYVSGVGTTFNGELNVFQRAYAKVFEDNFIGLGVGTGGTRRLNYGKDQFNDALKNVLINEAKKSEKDLGKYANEKKQYSFNEIDKQLKDHRIIKKINFYAFGFSRGAALARAFTNDLMWDCKDDAGKLTYGESDSPIEFKFLGIFDTVASFGLPATNLNNNLTFEGRDLVVDDRVKMCVHHVAANELRFCFPVDLIEQDQKLANGNWKEIVYPGMHSDVGGGYTPGSQDVNDNYARIPLKDMLAEAINAGVPMYTYDQLKEKHTHIFNEQFEIQADSQKYYEAVKSAVKPSKNIRTTINDYMKLYYSAYGTMDRQGIESVSQRIRRQDREGSKDDKYKLKKSRSYIPLGPKDMATEMNRLQSLKRGNGTYNVLLPGTGYKYIIQMDDWILDSWNQDVNDDVMKFYLDYVHDSKYGFMLNAEPFSYFRQRTIYEPRRSRKGEEIDEQRKKAQLVEDSKNVTQQDLMNEFEKAEQEESTAIA